MTARDAVCDASRGTVCHAVCHSTRDTCHSAFAPRAPIHRPLHCLFIYRIWPPLWPLSRASQRPASTSPCTSLVTGAVSPCTPLTKARHAFTCAYSLPSLYMHLLLPSPFCYTRVSAALPCSARILPLGARAPLQPGCPSAPPHVVPCTPAPPRAQLPIGSMSLPSACSYEHYFYASLDCIDIVCHQCYHCFTNAMVCDSVVIQLLLNCLLTRYLTALSFSVLLRSALALLCLTSQLFPYQDYIKLLQFPMVANQPTNSDL